VDHIFYAPIQLDAAQFASSLTRRIVQTVLGALGLAVLQPSIAQSVDPATAQAAGSATITQDERWLAKFQTTYVWQKKSGFDAPYTGQNSLTPSPEKSYSFSATAFLGWRPWQGTEIYVNPEVVQGVALSNLTGLAGVTNGEIQKVAGPKPTLYRARLFLRQTIGFSGGRQALEAGFNQFTGEFDKRRLVLTAGNFALNDIFDSNSFSHDPRTQFLNWTMMDYGAWDFASDSRGFTRGAAAELYYDDWVFRLARVLMPAESNGLPLNPHLFRSYGDNLEIEHAHQMGGQPGKWRFLAFRNVAVMARYSDANVYAAAHGGAPDLSKVRTDQSKTGFGVSLEQNLSSDIGLFGRYSQNDGEGEEFAYAEVDRSLLAGISIKGTRWGRADDTVGLALVRNGISSAHREYLANGGLGYFLGDGKLNYRSEEIVEAYYSLKLAQRLWTTFDYQRIANPAYNADRGPVNVLSLRLHAEF
jgi:high affinity Mn2+ porin